MQEITPNINVFDAALLRLDWIFNTFDEVCVSLSGGKRSTVLLHLVATIAKANNKKINVIFIDWEAQHSHTIAHVQEMKSLYTDVINAFYWVALPLSAVNAHTPEATDWVSWEEGVEWWRMPPTDAIIDRTYFPFYRYAMTCKTFMAEFMQWFSPTKTAALLSGCIAEGTWERATSFPSTSIRCNPTVAEIDTVPGGPYSRTFYPIYDWQGKDIWLFNNLSKALYNPLYDLMYRSGMLFNDVKIPEPFEQQTQRNMPHLQQAGSKRTLNHHCENSVAENAARKPRGHTWHSYALLLLNTMPRKTAEHYRENIARYLRRHQRHGYAPTLPDEQKSASEETASWEKICSMILAQDYRCRALDLTPPRDRDDPLSHSRKKARRGRNRGNDAIFL